ncbi:hypothetical protein [Nostoc sp. FACHB-892]|nr:hypothetical protein [Nostoc sp. FACHB-892]
MVLLQRRDRSSIHKSLFQFHYPKLAIVGCGGELLLLAGGGDRLG